MSDTWRQEYQKLTEFIGTHPEIVISQDSVITPETSRADFYSLFNKVRETLAEEMCSTTIEESSTIAGGVSQGFCGGHRMPLYRYHFNTGRIR